MSADAPRFDPMTGRPLPAPFDRYTGMPLAAGPAVVDGVPAGTTLSSPARRLAAMLLDSLLCVLTLFVGWLVWSLIVMKDGRTPAKQLMGMRTVHAATARPARWWRMALREIVAKNVVGLAIYLTFGLGLILYFWLLWDGRNQQLWDKVADTVVVNDPRRVLG